MNKLNSDNNIWFMEIGRAMGVFLLH